MKLIIASLFFAVASAFAQCPTGTNFPTSLDTDQNLTIAENNLGTNLTATLSPSDTTMIVTATAGWVPYMTATVDTGTNAEVVFVTSVVSSTVLGIARNCELIYGSNGIPINPGSHSAGSPVVNNVTAYSGSYSMKSAIKAIEVFVQSGGLTGTINPGTQYQAAYYVNSGSASVLGGDSGFTYNQPSALLTATNISTSALTISTLTGINPQCLQVDGSGVVTGTGSACGSGGGSGTVTASPQFQIASFTSSGTTALVAGTSGFTIQSGTMTVPALKVSGIASGTQCLQANSSGVVSGTGSGCSSNNSGTANQLGYYATTGTALSGATNLTYNGSTLSTPGVTITGISGTQCLQSASGIVGGSGVACPVVNSGTTGQVPFYSASTTLSGSANLTWSTLNNRLSTFALTISSLGSTQCLQEISGAVSGIGNPCVALGASAASSDVAYFTSANSITGNGSFNYNSGSGLLTVTDLTTSVINVTNLIASSTIQIGSSGAHVVYRCLTAGATLPTGTLTIDGSACGTTANTDLSVQ